MAVNRNPRFIVPLEEGRIRTWSLTEGDDIGSALALLFNGSVFVAGSSPGNGGRDFSLLGLRADGLPDATFGSEGTKVLSVGPGDDQAQGVAVLANGRVVLAGRSGTGTDRTDAAVVRLMPDGQADPSFGKAGTVLLDFGGTLDQAAAVVALPDGSLLVAGESATGTGADFALARLKVDGTLDAAFGNAGKAIVSFGSGADRAHALAVQPDGAILAVGETLDSGLSRLAVLRLRSDGSPDTSFGIGGKSIVPSTANASGVAIAVQPDGRIVLAGSIDDGVNANFLVVRLTAAGLLDTTFGNNGVVNVSPGSGDDHATSLALQPDGKIVVAGDSARGTDTDFSIVRLNSNGTLDTSFSGDGKALITVSPGVDVARAVALQPDGDIVIAGDATVGTQRDVAVVRLTPSGEQDRSYGAIDSLAGSTVTYLQGRSPVRLDADAAIYDADLAAQGHYAGAALTLTRAGGTSAEDRFSAMQGSPLSLAGGRAVWSGVEVGSVFEGPGSLSIRFNSQATPTRVNEVLRNLAYANVGASPSASINLHWTFSDGNQGAQGTGGLGTFKATTEVRIRTSNAAPEITAPLTDLAWNEGAAESVVIPAITFTDPDGETLTFSATLPNGNPLPDWLAFAAATRTLSGTPPADSPDLTVRVRATDMGGLFATTDVLIRTLPANEGLQLTGTDFNDTLSGSREADRLSGGKGDDGLTGGRGNDLLDGGQGTDIVTFAGRFSEYGIVDGETADTLIVTDSVAGRDGTDTLVAVELMRFSDGLRNTSDRLPPGKPGKTVQGTESADRLAGTADIDTLEGLGGNDQLSGGDGNDVLRGGKGDDVLDGDAAGRGGADAMFGDDGDDTYFFDNANDVATEKPSQGTDTIRAPFSLSLANFTDVENLLADGPGPVTLTGNELANRLVGTPGNDSFTGGGGNDRIEGGSGIDVARFSGTRASHGIQVQTGTIEVTASAGPDGVDQLQAVERVRFADVGLAFDIDGNAGNVARLLVAVFGLPSLRDPSHVGIGLDLADKGRDAQALATFAINFTGLTTPQAVVAQLWTNVVGSPPTAEQAKPFVDQLTSSQLTPGQMAWFAATSALNETNVDLVGLAKTGLAFVEPG